VAWSRAAARLARSSSRGDQRRASSLGQRRPDPAAPVLSGGGVVEDLAPAASSSSVRRCQLCSACRSSHFRRLDVSAGSGTRRCSSVVLFLSARWHPRSLSLSLRLAMGLRARRLPCCPTTSCPPVPGGLPTASSSTICASRAALPLLCGS
jgi:hypothetical protein